MTQSNRILLGVNIDHVATLRQARGTRYPDPVKAALDAEEAGADGITVHLREDRRHIQERDVLLLKDVLQTRMNFEMGVTEEMMAFAERIRPAHICLVPETRQELTTEGGLDVAGGFDRVTAAVRALKRSGILVSLFIDPDLQQIQAAADSGADYIEMHTGSYANAAASSRAAELDRLKAAAAAAADLHLRVNAGHGIDYENIRGILEIPHLCELNIGHSIIGRAILVGIEQAVREMLALMRNYQG